MKIKSQTKTAQTPVPLESAAPAEVAPAVVEPPKVAEPAEVAPAVVEPPKVAEPAKVAEPSTVEEPAKVAELPTLKRIATAPNVSFLLHPYTGRGFDQAPVELEAIDGWTQSQIDAGKLVEC